MTEEYTFIGRPPWTSHYGLPFEKLRLGLRAEVLEEWEGFAVVVFEFLKKAFGWWRW